MWNLEHGGARFHVPGGELQQVYQEYICLC